MKRSVAEVFAIADDQLATFTKAVSIGLLAGNAMAIAQKRCAAEGLNAVMSEKANVIAEFRRVLIENRNRQYRGLSTPVSDEEIEAILCIVTMDNDRIFFNNLTVK